MRSFVVLATLIGLAFSQSVASLQAEIESLRTLIEDRRNGEITFYANRNDCPEGYYPVENAYGRIIVIDGPKRGSMSKHSFDDVRKMNVDCTDTIGVAENGFQRVCSHTQTGSSLDVKLNEMLPYWKVMACARNNGPSPVLP